MKLEVEWRRKVARLCRESGELFYVYSIQSHLISKGIMLTEIVSQVWVANTPLSEDCLYLQVARPVLRRMERIPVMVWIYGGSFYSGTYTLDLYDPKVLATEQVFIFKTVNHHQLLSDSLFN